MHAIAQIGTYQQQTTEEKSFCLIIGQLGADLVKDRVKAVRVNSYQTAIKIAHKSPGVIKNINLYTTALRIAAAIIIMPGSATIYKYMAVNTQSLYEQQFTGYALTTLRGVAVVDAQFEAYRNKNWNEVIGLNKGTIPKTNKSVFLTAMAMMELKQFPDAITLFQGVLANKSDDSFRDEADYFLALACLADHQESKGLNKIAEIKANPDHTYYPMINQITAIDMKIIELKKK